MEELRGTVERITFHSTDSGFAVLRVRANASGGVVTVVGKIPLIAEGESILASGEWKTDRNHGLQFQAATISPQLATGRAQIETFLGSGLIRGVGPHLATKLYEKFGDDVFEIIENSPKRLREVSGIGAAKSRTITESWKEQKSMRELMLFLQDSGIGVARAHRIHKQFGADAVRLIRENPYRLAEEVRGIGFASADALALKLGLDRNAMERMRAGVVHALSEGATSGHCGMPREELIKLAVELLGADAARIDEAINFELQRRRLIRDTLEGRESIFLPSLYYAEKRIGSDLQRLATGKPPWPHIDADKAIEWVQKSIGIELAASQKNAVRLVVESKVAVITGGPGVGKTTLVNSLLRIIRAKKANVLLAAPTGRAAKRLSESTGLEAKTIHRLLEVDAATGSFQRNEENPLRTDLLVVDEASMIDVPLMDALVRALPSSAALLIVGDVDQLPAVGPGQVLSDIIDSAAIPIVRLTEVFRQAAESRIITTAHAINHGVVPELGGGADSESDFFFIEAADPVSAAQKIIQLVAERIPRRFAFDPRRDIQLLVPMRKGPVGVVALNTELQRTINTRSTSSSTAYLERFGTRYYIDDKVMQTANDYDKEIFNGDIGVVRSINTEDGELTVDFDGRSVEFTLDELDDLVLAYATTIHKSQGSEYPAVVVAVMKQHAIMLQRNLLYTAVTRGRKLVVLVGQREAVEMAVRTRSTRRRHSKLKEWLRQGPKVFEF